MKDYGPGNAPEDYNTLSEGERNQLDLWIQRRIVPASKVNNRLTSYRLKHIMERETGLYVTNGQFKGAMQKAGYKAFDTDFINWAYKMKLLGEHL